MPDWMQLEQLQSGQVVRGKIKRVEAFGAFRAATQQLADGAGPQVRAVRRFC